MNIPRHTFLFTLCIASAAFAPMTTSAMKIIKKGDSVGIFYVTKIAGAETDGVKPGQRLCYRCRYGSRPMVMVFARKMGQPLGDLVRYLDQTISENKSAKVKGLVTLLGDDQEILKQSATQLLEDTQAKDIPLAIATEMGVRANQYELPEGAEVTIVVAKDSRVLHTLVYDVDKIDLEAVQAEVQAIVQSKSGRVRSR